MGLPVEVMHRKAGVAGDFVQTLAGRYRLFHHVVVTVDHVFCNNTRESTGAYPYINQQVGTADRYSFIIQELIQTESAHFNAV
jgi:hypothetical protein